MKLKCIIVDDDEMSLKVLKHMVEKSEFLQLMEEFRKSPDAAAYLEENKVDLLFLDIEMPSLTGLELLNTLEDPPAVIIVSGKKDYALDAFDFNVVDYLLKPPSFPRFLKAVLKARKVKREGELEGSSKYVFVKADSLLVKVNLNEVLWVEALADYVIIVTEKKKYIVHSTMKSMVQKLPKKEFIRVHRSYIIRLDQISVIEDNTLVVGEKLIPIGRTYREGLMDGLNLI